MRKIRSGVKQDLEGGKIKLAKGKEKERSNVEHICRDPSYSTDRYLPTCTTRSDFFQSASEDFGRIPA